MFSPVKSSMKCIHLLLGFPLFSFVKLEIILRYLQLACIMFSVLNDVTCHEGMHHQGVFRVSGSQHEINEFRNQFEQGTFVYCYCAFCLVFPCCSKTYKRLLE